VTVVWLGNDDNSPTKRVSGSGLPAEIWARYMKAAHLGQQPQALPGGLWRSQPGALDATPLAQTVPRPNGAMPARQDNPDRPWTPPSQSDRSFLERLFGG
jgi:penicillin-binding protein 1A